ncbi:helix-turn-helix domain-containing protein [Streptomyces sp. NPDC059875]|uniref:helix-turn-helix domain-containing protein n=1 Tax=unclassified Streptomyces TaxID=2593676 RepID=UPI00364CA0F7
MVTHVKRAFKYRFQPSDGQAAEQSRTYGCVRKVYKLALVMPHRRRAGEELPDWRQAHNKSHKQVRTRVEHAFARMKTWKILRDCRLRCDGVHTAVLGVARLHDLALTG